MSARELLAELQARGVRLRCQGDTLQLRTASGALPPSLREAVTAHKQELLALLAPAEGEPEGITSEAVLLAVYGLQRCRQCQRILVQRHLVATVAGSVCTDWEDCQNARAAAGLLKAQSSSYKLE
jgi:hypothetical protein